MKDSYGNSRTIFGAELISQVSPITGENLYDPDGFITRMNYRGEPKSLIEQKLMEDSMFKANLEKMKEGPETDDPLEKYMIDGFATFYEALQNLKNPEEPVDVRNYVSELLSEEYPNAEKAQKLIKEGEPALKVFEALDEDLAWKQDAVDYMTRMDIDIPTDRQKSRWVKFMNMTHHINDLSRYN